MNITIPQDVGFILDTLEAQGHEAYAVGGCIRDTVLGKEPKDWDICTQALPEETMSCFEGHHLLETGLKHGTVTLVLHNQSYEITTYRVEDVYSDSRHPDKVTYVHDLKEDLSRRDFTINAMAYNPNRGLVDLHGGIQDIESQIVRCVGVADSRFKEDALRIMRALRFASTLGFSIEDQTSQAILNNRELLQSIAVERITAELDALLLGKNVEQVLLDYRDVIEEIIPEVASAVGFGQNNSPQLLDAWEHTAKSISKAPLDKQLKLALLLHAIAKPECAPPVDPAEHVSGCSQASSDLARQILRRLKYDNETIDAVAQLILYYDADIKPERIPIKRWLNRIGEKRFRQLIEVKKADALAQQPECLNEEIEALNSATFVLDEVLAQHLCFTLQDLAVDGSDLLAAGVPEGKKIGIVLNQLLDMVIDESIENEEKQLLEKVKAGF